MTSLGGSVMQVLVPVACGIAFATSSPSPFGVAVACWWAGENLLDVAIYINDARSLTLVLLGGHTGAEVEGHDWEHILGLTHLSMYDHHIAWTVHAAGANRDGDRPGARRSPGAAGRRGRNGHERLKADTTREG